MAKAELILLVGGADPVRALISYTLERAGYRVHTAPSEQSAVQEAFEWAPDLIALDVLPDMASWKMCRHLRARSDVPILMVSGLTDNQSVVAGLSMGADDYVTKPFSPMVLLARVQALLRRRAARSAQAVMEFGGLTVDTASRQLRRDGAIVHLTPIEFDLLAALARRPGKVFSPHQLLALIKGREMPTAQSREIVKVHIRHLRHKIETHIDDPSYVLTVRGAGYMLNPEHAVDDTDRQPATELRDSSRRLSARGSEHDYAVLTRYHGQRNKLGLYAPNSGEGVFNAIECWH